MIDYQLNLLEEIEMCAKRLHDLENSVEQHYEDIKEKFLEGGYLLRNVQISRMRQLVEEYDRMRQVREDLSDLKWELENPC